MNSISKTWSLPLCVTLWMWLGTATPALAQGYLLPAERDALVASPKVDLDVIEAFETRDRVRVAMTFTLPTAPGFDRSPLRGSAVHPTILTLANIVQDAPDLKETGSFLVLTGTVEAQGLLALESFETILAITLEDPGLNGAPVDSISAPLVACTASATKACIQGGDFGIEVTNGRVVATSFQSAVFSFFGTTNWEVLVKVLDGCSINSHYWVFAAGATQLGYTITISDHRNNPVPVVKTFGNQCPVANVTAFTCAILK